MPFESEKQRRYLYENHPEVAKKMEADAKKGASPWSYVKMPGTDEEREKIKKSFLGIKG